MQQEDGGEIERGEGPSGQEIPAVRPWMTIVNGGQVKLSIVNRTNMLESTTKQREKMRSGRWRDRWVSLRRIHERKDQGTVEQPCMDPWQSTDLLLLLQMIRLLTRVRESERERGGDGSECHREPTLFIAGRRSQALVFSLSSCYLISNSMIIPILSRHIKFINST